MPSLKTLSEQLAADWEELARALLSRRLMSALTSEAGPKLSPPALHAIFVLSQSRRRVGSLAKTLGLDESTVTRLVDRLEANGLAERRQAEDDRRAVAVELTPAGEELVARMHEHRRAFMAEVLKLLDPNEREEFVRLTAKAADALRAREQEAARA